jgi:hypothetical protein
MKTAEEFLRENRCADFEALSKIHLKRARITAALWGSATIISLIFLIFAFIQKAETEKQRAKVAELYHEMKEMKQQAELQIKHSQEAMAEADKQRALAVANEKLALECMSRLKPQKKK